MSRIAIFPIKALDGLLVGEAPIRAGGGLAGDREFAIFDESGRAVNGKRNARVHALRASYDLGARVVSLATEGTTSSPFHLDDDRARLEAWLADYFGFAVHLRHDTHHGFPDDSMYFGPTIVCTETLLEVTSWFPGFELDAVRQRFRANLELGGGGRFWEDRLVARDDATVAFRVGDVQLEGTVPWPRCAVPTRDPRTGATDPTFQKTFSDHRRATLPPWAPRSRFDHFYRLCVGTRVPASEAGKVLRVGDSVTILN
ncbi:MAG: MOSC domain-containing protein [Armatimonadota bacterium]